jgi:hypothetical protein
MPNLEEFSERRRSTTQAVPDAVGAWRELLVPAVVGTDGERRGRAVPVPEDDAAKRSGSFTCATAAVMDVVVVLFVGAVLGVWSVLDVVGVAQCCQCMPACPAFRRRVSR